MEFRKVLALRGPNIWTNSPVIEAWVDLGELDRPSTDFPGFNDRLMNWLPTMIEHRCSIGERGGFFERLRQGTYPGHILEHVTLELHGLVGVDVGFGRARETSQPGVYRVVFAYAEETLGRQCLVVARELVLAAIHDRPFDVKGEVQKLRALADEVLLGPSTRAIVAAARLRGIPARRLNTGSLVQLGYGARQRRIQAAETDRTGAIAEEIAQDKELTRTLLAAVGVPVPQGRTVADADDAWAAAQEIGVPAVVKPQDGNQGRGVATNLTTREQVAAAYRAALQESQSGQVVVERFALGHDYRLLVVAGRVVAAARREPAQVSGDGVHSVRELIDIANADPRRGEHHATVLSKIKLDTVALAVLSEQGFTPDSVPPVGSSVLIRRNGNLSTGGTAIDVTERVHPQVAARAI
jgi:cyanophycin synthetase